MIPHTVIPNAIPGTVVDITFPSSDKYWSQLLKFLKKNDFLNEKMIAPLEFASVSITSDPYAFSFFTPPEEYSLIIIHKGNIESISLDFIKIAQSKFNYVFGNAVFLVYAKNRIPNQANKDHEGVLNLFFEKLHEKKQKTRYFIRTRRYKTIHSNFFDTTQTKFLKILPFAKLNICNQRNHKATRFLILSANNMGNIGDDIVSLASKDQIVASFPDAAIRFAKVPVCRADIEWCDYLILGGGGLLYDRCMQNCLNYCQALFIAKELGRKTVCLGQGTQGIVTKPGREIFREALSSCEFISVRNEKDREVLNEIGVTAPIFKTADMAFHYYKPNQTATNKDDSKKIIITAITPRFIRGPVNKIYRETLDQIIHFLHQNYEPVFVKHSNDDMDFYLPYKKKWNIPILQYNWKEPHKAFDIYQKAGGVITGRLHSLILATLTDTPVISITGKASKISSVVKRDIPSLRDNIIELGQLDFEHFVSKFQHIYSKQKTADKMEINKLYQQSQQNIVLLKDFLKK